MLLGGGDLAGDGSVVRVGPSRCPNGLSRSRITGAFTSRPTPTASIR